MSRYRVAKFRRIYKEYEIDTCSNNSSDDTSSSHDSNLMNSVNQLQTPLCDTYPSRVVPTINDGVGLSSSRNDNIILGSDAKDSETSFSSSESDYLASDNEKPQIADILINWYNTFTVSQNALTGLLHGLKIFHEELPLSATTLLNSRSTESTDTTVADNGEYIFFDAKEQILKCLTTSKEVVKLNIDSKLYQSFVNEASIYNKKLITAKVSVDGVPIFRSTNKSLWPISLIVNEAKPQRPFVIAAFYGKSKPSQIDTYFQKMVDDLQVLLKDGISIRGDHFIFRIFCFIADAPARNLIKATKQFTGYYSCDFCRQPGLYDSQHRKIIFPDTNWEKRTNDEFRRNNESGHQASLSPLVRIPTIDMINQFPPESMHSVYMGVTKRLMKFYIHRLWRPSERARVTENIIRLSTNFPKDFKRKLCGLDEMDHWKAKQFRQFLLYLAPLVLKDFLPQSLYNHFVHFHFAIYSLSIDEFRCYLPNARASMTRFIQKIPECLNSGELVYNTHLMIHLVDFVDRLGPLDFWSAFPFENYFHHLKKNLRSPSNVLAQLKHYNERKFVADKVSSQLTFGSHNDKYALTDKGILAISRPYGCVTEGTVVSGYLLKLLRDIYEQPYPSSTHHIGIYQKTDQVVSGKYRRKCITFSLEDDTQAIFPYVTNDLYID